MAPKIALRPIRAVTCDVPVLTMCLLSMLPLPQAAERAGLRAETGHPLLSCCQHHQ